VEIVRSMRIDQNLFVLVLAVIPALLYSADSAQAALGDGIGTVAADGFISRRLWSRPTMGPTPPMS
jgi:hypothetical protein